MPRGRPSHRPVAVREAREALLEANPLRAAGSTSFTAAIVEHVFESRGLIVTPSYVRKILGRSGRIGHEKGQPSPGKRVKRLEDAVRRAEVERALRNRGDASNNEVARRLGISSGNLRLWVKDLEAARTQEALDRVGRDIERTQRLIDEVCSRNTIAMQAKS